MGRCIMPAGTNGRKLIDECHDGLHGHAPELDVAELRKASAVFGETLAGRSFGGADVEEAERPLPFVPGIELRSIDNGPPPERRQQPSYRDRRAMFRDALMTVRDQSPKPPFDHYTVADLDAISCRWPVSGEGAATLHCGRDSVGGAPYCTRHCRLAYAPRNGSRA